MDGVEWWGVGDQAQVMMKGRRFLCNSLVVQANQRPESGLIAPMDSSDLPQSVSLLFTVDKYGFYFGLFSGH